MNNEACKGGIWKILIEKLKNTKTCLNVANNTVFDMNVCLVGPSNDDNINKHVITGT